MGGRQSPEERLSHLGQLLPDTKAMGSQVGELPVFGNPDKNVPLQWRRENRMGTGEIWAGDKCVACCSSDSSQGRRGVSGGLLSGGRAEAHLKGMTQ